MKRHIVTILTLATVLLASKAFAWQEVDAIAIDYNVDFSRKICTYTIDREHDVTTSTNGCKHSTFSWQCLPDDYRLELAKASYKNSSVFTTRYSEYACHSFTNNMLMLTNYTR